MKDITVSKMLSDARYASGKSQEQMATALSVSRKTIANWESGDSFPSFPRVLDWFNVCDEPIYPYVMKYLHPDELDRMTQKKEHKDISKALHILIEELPEQYQRELLFILTGTHFSSPVGILDMMTTYLHTPLELRLNIAENIMSNYKLSKARGHLVSEENIEPCINVFGSCIEHAKEAAFTGRKTYMEKDEQ